jgi:hypothetical protein
LELREKKYLADQEKCGLDTDSADFAVGPNQATNMENFRFGSTDKGVIGTLESIGGTALIPMPDGATNYITIGSVEDTENGLLVRFQYDNVGDEDRIEVYFKAINTVYIALTSSQVAEGLNFSKNSLIHSCRIINGMLYWVEGISNQPRKINLYAGLKLNNPSFDTDIVPYPSILSFSEITVIKPPPGFSPNIQKAYDGTFVNNFIGNDSFEAAFQYSYYDNEVSVVGSYSPASRLNDANDTSNYIAIQMDSLEVVPNTVRIVNLVIRYGNTNKAFIVKTWDKEVVSEALEISNQNSNISQLTYNFYNDIIGEAIPVDYVLKAADSVPIYAYALETAKNRLFLGNTIKGYDTPTTTSLEVALSTAGISGVTSIVRNLIEVRAYIGVPGPSNDYKYAGWFVYINTGITTGYYYLNGTEVTLVDTNFPFPFSIPPPTLAAPPTSTSPAGLTYAGATQAEVMDFIIPPGDSNEGQVFYTRSNLITITGLTASVNNVFKSRSSYKIGIVFYDFAMRKCGVVTNEGLVATIPSRSYPYTNAVNGIIWELDNTNALAEIPEWAYYYSVVRTLNQRTRFFVQSFDKAAKYATKDADGIYLFTTTTYNTNVAGIGIDTTALVAAGLGYVYTVGDIAIIIDTANNIFELPIIAQSGNYVVIKAADIGDLSTLEFVYELYTPYQSSVQEPFFEIGQMYQILNPTTSLRQYDVLTDVLGPDAYSLTRNYLTTTYYAEAMSPNDLFYQRWDNDGGKPNFITRLGQSVKGNFISWSNTFIPGTSINGLSTFEPLSETNVPEDNGAIQKLILTSKVQGEGTIMLSIGVETASLYLGEVQITDSTGATQFFSGSQSVIGTINTLMGSFGTINPESVIAYRGYVFWFDANSGRYVQYAGNGLFAISNYQMTRFWKLFSDQYKSMTQSQIEALGSRPFIFSTVDPHHNELVIAIPKLLDVPPKGYLPDNTEEIYPFDIWDGQAKTIVYKIDANPPRWMGVFNWTPENFVTLQNQLFSSKDGQLYLHNDTSNYNLFYGTLYKSRIMPVSNIVPDTPKVYNNIAISANFIPTRVYLYTDFSYQQCTDLMDTDFRSIEGVYYSIFYRNKLEPTATGYRSDRLLTGDKMRGVTMNILIEFTINGFPAELKFINLGVLLSKGHATLNR